MGVKMSSGAQVRVKVDKTPPHHYASQAKQGQAKAEQQTDPDNLQRQPTQHRIYRIQLPVIALLH